MFDTDGSVSVLPDMTQSVYDDAPGNAISRRSNGPSAGEGALPTPATPRHGPRPKALSDHDRLDWVFAHGNTACDDGPIETR